jgi:hypothetical protein
MGGGRRSRDYGAEPNCETPLNDLAIAAIAFFCAIGAALIGALLRAKLPAHHLEPESKDVLKLVMGLIATLSALVLGLLIAAAQSSYNSQVEAIEKVAANVVEMDRFLALYGPETTDARGLVRQSVAQLHARVWSTGGMNREAIGTARGPTPVDKLYRQLASLDPKTEAQRFALNRTMQLADEIGLMRMLMYEQGGTMISPPFLVILIFWISVLFLGFGLLARFNPTLAVVLFVGALSVSGAILLILELHNPYHGLILLSDAPIRGAMAQLAASAK